MSMIGKTILHYKIIEKLGEGGMGVVYKAEDTKLKRMVALKFLPLQAMAGEEEKARFEHEAQAAAALDHPNICTVHEINESDGQTFIAMVYVEGQSLQDVVTQGPAPLPDVLTYAIQSAEGLQAAHEKEIVHRDIKPANILITEKGQVRITDFGLAKLAGRTQLTKKGTSMGTIAYMSPEQTQGIEVDHRTDIWALGAVIYEMITGRQPFIGDYEQAVTYSIMNEDPEPPTSLRTGVPMELERIVFKALAKRPDERYQHVDEMLVDLKALQKTQETRVAQSQANVGMCLQAGSAKKYPILIGSLAVIAVLVIAGLLIFRTTPSVSTDKKSIAVLAFTNMSADPNQEYFCDGISEELINALSKVEGLRVAARTSAFYFKGRNVEISEIGEKLNVGTVLEGSVRKSDTSLRITAQLINVADGFHVWSDTYDRAIEDIFDIQEEITESIVNKLKIQLLGAEKAQLVKRQTENLEAYHLYLKGRYFWNRRYEGGLLKSLEYFQKAIEVDPTYALAYAGLADSYNVLAFWGFMRPKEAFPKGKAAANKALEIDKNLAEAHASLALVSVLYDLNRKEAEKKFRLAIELNPNYTPAHLWYAIFHLATLGRFDEALTVSQLAETLDPLSLVMSFSTGSISYLARRYQEAISKFQETLDMESDFVLAKLWRGLAYTEKGLHDEAIKDLEEAFQISEGSAIATGFLGYAYAKNMQSNKAKQMLDSLNKSLKQKYIPYFYIAMIHAGLGEYENSLESLEQAYDENDTMCIMLKVWPAFDSLHGRDQFKTLLKKLGLEE